jgi:hypothetical protein
MLVAAGCDLQAEKSDVVKLVKQRLSAMHVDAASANLKFPLIFWIKWRKGESKQRDEGFCECLNVDMHVK